MQKEDAVPSDIFPHVYSFLVRFGFLKSAKLFRKEANVPRVVVDTPGLLDFYEAFKKRKKKFVDALQTEEKNTSKKRKAEKKLNKQALKKKKKKESTSESSSEEEEEQKIVTKKPNSHVRKTFKNIDSKKKNKLSVSANVQPAEEESSSSSSSDNEPTKSNGFQVDGGASSSVLPKHKKIAAAVKKSASSSSGDSSSEDDNPGDAASSTAAKQKDDSDSSTNSSSDTPTPKQSIPIAEPHTIPKANKKPKAMSTSSQPFCRVDKQTIVNPKLANNSFEAKSGARGSWGEKAHHVLKNTKGRSFRHEKTKKKRGSYTGGKIDVSVHSIKFDDSD